MIVKCPNCDGPLSFDAGSGKMKCEYCGGEFETEAVNNQPAQEYMECNIYSCTSCGAELAINGVETSTFCAYCGQPSVVFSRVSQELKPKYIVPFSVSREEAISIIRNKLSKGKYVPEEIKNFKEECVRGIYIPYWLFDIDYEDQQMIRGEVGSDDNKKTRLYYRHAKCSFDDVALDASERLADETSQRLEPYKMSEKKPFDPNYLSGFFADKYDVEANDVMKIARERTKKFFDDEVKETVSASNKVIVGSNPKVTFKEKSYTMLPAWFLTFRYQDEPYTFLVNGQTKKVVGGVPYDKGKFAVTFGILSVIMSVISIFVLWKFFYDPEELDTLFEIAGLGIFFSVGIGWAFLHGCKQAIERSKSKVMLNFVKDRQGDK